MPADIPSFFENPSKASLSFLLLMLISYTPKHGYVLVQEIEKHTEGRWKPSHSAVYKLLNDLEEGGYISSWEDMNGERSKRVYQISEKGIAFLAETERDFESFINAFISTLLVAKDITNPDDISVLFTNKGKAIIRELEPADRRRILTKIKIFLDDEIVSVNEQLASLKVDDAPRIGVTNK